MTLVFFISIIAGCLDENSEREKLELIIDYDDLKAIVGKTYDSGNLVNTDIAVIEFEFNRSKSPNGITTFGIDSTDPNVIVVNDSNSASLFELQFEYHGVYNVEPYMIDTNGNKKSTILTIKIGLKVDWYENKTSNPSPMVIDSRPENNASYPKYMKIESNVENPRDLTEIGGGQSVQFLWSITDEYGDTCQTKNDNVGDGETATWETIYFNTLLTHDLNVEYEEGQDYLDIHHHVTLFYDEQ